MLALFFAKERRFVDAAIRFSKWAATGGAAMLAIGATARAIQKPDIDLFLDEAPLVANGEYEVHNIGVDRPHHIFVNHNFEVIGAA